MNQILLPVPSEGRKRDQSDGRAATRVPAANPVSGGRLSTRVAFGSRYSRAGGRPRPEWVIGSKRYCNGDPSASSRPMSSTRGASNRRVPFVTVGALLAPDADGSPSRWSTSCSSSSSSGGPVTDRKREAGGCRDRCYDDGRIDHRTVTHFIDSRALTPECCSIGARRRSFEGFGGSGGVTGRFGVVEQLLSSLRVERVTHDDEPLALAADVSHEQPRRARSVTAWYQRVPVHTPRRSTWR